MPVKKPVKILITSGASCPDALVEEVIDRIVSFFDDAIPVKQIASAFI